MSTTRCRGREAPPGQYECPARHLCKLHQLHLKFPRVNAVQLLRPASPSTSHCLSFEKVDPEKGAP